MNDTFFGRVKMMGANLGRSPVVFLDRVLNTLEIYYHTHLHRRPHYDSTLDLKQAAEEIAGHLSLDVSAIFQEKPLHFISEEIAASLGDDQLKGVRADFNADFDLARLCYILCRARRPRVVVETGVANGVTSTFLLQALDTNGFGELHSIDLPPLAIYGGREVGSLVPQRLRHRWQLSFGASRRILPSLLKRIGSIDMFVHDSLHSYHNVKRELRVVSEYLSRDGTIIVDDIAGNSGLLEWASTHHPRLMGVVRKRNGLFGYALR